MQVGPAQLLRTHWMTSALTSNVSNRNNNYKITLHHIAMLFLDASDRCAQRILRAPLEHGRKTSLPTTADEKSTITVRADPCQRSSASSPPTGGSNTLNPCPASPATPSASAGQPAAAAVLPSSTHTRGETVNGSRLRCHHKPHREHMSRRTGPTVAGFRNHPAAEL